MRRRRNVSASNRQRAFSAMQARAAAWFMRRGTRVHCRSYSEMARYYLYEVPIEFDKLKAKVYARHNSECCLDRRM